MTVADGIANEWDTFHSRKKKMWRRNVECVLRKCNFELSLFKSLIYFLLKRIILSFAYVRWRTRNTFSFPFLSPPIFFGWKLSKYHQINFLRCWSLPGLTKITIEKFIFSCLVMSQAKLLTGQNQKTLPTTFYPFEHFVKRITYSKQ